MKNSEKFEKAFDYFKKSYQYKMGGTQTVVLPNGKEKFFDEREYYSGKGAKYNKNIKHDEIGTVIVSRSKYSNFLKHLKEQELLKIQRIQEESELTKRIETAKTNGVYNILYLEHGNYIELSEKERRGRYFDADRLAKTLNISISDSQLLSSNGKTYVFAKQLSTNKIIELYHSDLRSNDLNISFSFVNEERLKEFNHDEWFSRPYAIMVGMTENKNHFVC